MRREKNAGPNSPRRRQPHHQIGAPGQNILKFHFQPGINRLGRQKIPNPPFSGMLMASRKKSRIHTGQGDKLAQELLGLSHCDGVPSVKLALQSIPLSARLSSGKNGLNTPLRPASRGIFRENH
jgi:hypothetical protein